MTTSKEDLYGTTTARITTYSVSLMPQDPAHMLALAARVKTALEEIADTRPAFDIPFDYTARDEAYERPARHRKWNEDDPITYDHIHVNVYDDRVQIKTWLDLDDVWNLYYLLEDIIQPNAQIAAAMDAARRAEERGVLLRKADMNAYYANSSMKPEEQMGSLDDTPAEDYVPKTMEDTLKLYALGEIDEEQFLQRTLVLADHTLTGRMCDPVGLLPAFNRLTDQSGKNGAAGALITYDEALRERTRDLLKIMTGTYNEDRPLFPALIKKVAEISKPLRDKLRAVALNEQIAIHENSLRELRGERSRNPFADLINMPDDKEDPKTRVKFANPTLTEEERQNRANIARTANIALRASDVGVTSDRTWRDTAYVSRSKNSLWVRKDLPSALKPFVRTPQRPDMRDALKLIAQ